MPLTADRTILRLPRLDMPWSLLEAARVDCPRKPCPIRRLLIHHLLINPIVTLEPAVLEVLARDRDSHVPVHHDAKLHLQVRCRFPHKHAG